MELKPMVGHYVLTVESHHHKAMGAPGMHQDVHILLKGLAINLLMAQLIPFMYQKILNLKVLSS